MYLQSIILLFKNTFQSFSSINYLSKYISTLWLFTITYTLPLLLYDWVSNLSGSEYIYISCVKIYTILYSIPGFVILYSIHNSKLSELLEIRYSTYNNPCHIYLTLLYFLIYIICLILTKICSSFYIIVYIAEVFSYSIFLNEIAYTFLDNSKYNYNNKIDFYNNNAIIFIIYGTIIYAIMTLFSPKYFLQGSFITISIVQNAFINLKYKTSDQTSYNYYNAMYPFERMLNILITIGSSIVLFVLRRRSITTFPV